jgi:hypothetical protein
MEEQTKTVDYQQAFNALPKSNEYWKPVEGRYTVEFLDELDMNSFREVAFEGDSESTKMWDVPVKVWDHENPADQGSEFSWSLPHGGESSKLGQVLKLGASYGSLKGRKAQVIVTGKGMKIRYTIVRADA